MRVPDAFAPFSSVRPSDREEQLSKLMIDWPHAQLPADGELSGGHCWPNELIRRDDRSRADLREHR